MFVAYIILTVLFTILEFIIWICKAVEWDESYGSWDYGKPPFIALFRTHDLVQFIFFMGLPIILLEIAVIFFISCIVNPDRHRDFLNKPLFVKEVKEEDEE